jgi:hypothetical protein
LYTLTIHISIHPKKNTSTISLVNSGQKKWIYKLKILLLDFWDGTTTSITLTLTGLINQIFDAVGVHNLPIKYTPASASPLVKDEEGEGMNATFNYSSFVGMLQYLQNHTRPDITYTVSRCARFAHFPKRSHEEAVIFVSISPWNKG